MKTTSTFKKALLTSTLFIFVTASNIVSAASSLPVESVPGTPSAFTALLNNNKVDLKWSTETESNLSHFIVERSADGTNFSNAALVFAYGNTTSKSNYVFADNISKLQSAVVYYRVIAVNADGKNLNSETRIIRTEK